MQIISKKQTHTFLFLITFSLFFNPAYAHDQTDHGNLSLTFENDLFALTDRYYTNGVNILWMFPLPENAGENFTRAVRLSLGQIMYTPSDITLEKNEKDRLYAGIAYLGAGLEQRFSSHSNLFQMEFGVVGPNSFAGDMQEFVHWLFKLKTPRGWDDQLNAGPVFTIWGSHKRRIAAGSFRRDWSFEILGHLGGSIGNVVTAAAGGLELRAGLNMNNNLGSFFIRPGGEGGTTLAEGYAPATDASSLSLQIFAFAGGHGILRNIFLDGSGRLNSSRIEKRNFVGDLVLGIDLLWKPLVFRYSYVCKTQQFLSQTENHIIGSLNFRYAW